VPTEAGEEVRALDVIVKNEGTIVWFTPVSEVAQEWFKENIVYEPWQWLGQSLAADRQPAQELLAGINRRGLRVHVEME
jgi:hypothetical protein